MSNYKVTGAQLTGIANAIRTKGGTSAQLEFPTGFVSAVQAIPTGGGGSLYYTRLTPLHFDLTNGYVSGANWNYSPSSDQYRSDVYEVEANKKYMVHLGSVVGNRFRCAFFTQDPGTETSGLTGIDIGQTDNPNPFAVRWNATTLFIPQASGYLTIDKSSSGENGVETFVTEFDESGLGGGSV